MMADLILADQLNPAKIRICPYILLSKRPFILSKEQH